MLLCQASRYTVASEKQLFSGGQTYSPLLVHLLGFFLFCFCFEVTTVWVKVGSYSRLLKVAGWPLCAHTFVQCYKWDVSASVGTSASFGRERTA